MNTTITFAIGMFILSGAEYTRNGVTIVFVCWLSTAFLFAMIGG